MAAEFRGWSFGLTRAWEATRAVGTPYRAKTWAISTPVGPAPRTIRLLGSSRVLVASRLVHGRIPSSPSMSGTVECEPTATTIDRALRIRCSPSAVTATLPGPSMRADPRMTTAPSPSSPRTCPASLGNSVPSRLIM